MVQPTGAFDTVTAIGQREDLEDIIYNISPTDTPFMSNIARMRARAVAHEWQTDSLAAHTAGNRQIEGDDVSGSVSSPTVRLKNYCQISRKDVVITGTVDEVDKAGRASETAYQLAKKGKELKRDIEASLTQANGSSAGGSATARSSASLESWLATNKTSLGEVTATNTTPGYASASQVVSAVGDASSVGTLSEANLKSVIQACWTQGGDPTMVMCGPYNKTKISGFSGIATLYKNIPGNRQATIIGAADLYVSDFGEHTIVPNRFNRDRTVTVLDMDFWGVAYLRPMQQKPLAKTGDSEKRFILAEYTLVSKNEAASGKVSDLATS